MAVGTLVVVLEDILSTVGTAGYLSRNVDATRGASLGAVANLMTAFGTLDYHLFKSKL